MKQLTNAERLAIAVPLLDGRGLMEYTEQCKDMENLELQAIRKLADSLQGEVVLLPNLPPLQWIGKTMNDNKKHIRFFECDLAEILNFIADMVE